MTPTRFRTLLIAAVFLAMLGFPVVNAILGLVHDLPNRENRALAPFPALQPAEMDSFPARFERYCEDHFPLRYRFIAWNSLIRWRVFDESPIPDQAIIGKDGWYFMAGKEQWSYIGKATFTPAELDTIRAELEYRTEWLRKRGTRFYFCPVPSKNKVYAAYMPTDVSPLWDASWGEQVLDHLQNHSYVSTVHLHRALQARAALELLYYKEDNHWTAVGAYCAANAILQRLHEDFPALQPLRRRELMSQRVPGHSRNITQMFGLEDQGPDSIDILVPHAGFRARPLPPPAYLSPNGLPYLPAFVDLRETADTTLPDMVLISDSFGEAIFPLLAEQFHRSLRLFDQWEYARNTPVLESERPDIVILLPTESNLRHLLNRH